eukprot:scaffold113031_cov28-Tisochrysis_lutea.AAC.1
MYNYPHGDGGWGCCVADRACKDNLASAGEKVEALGGVGWQMAQVPHVLLRAHMGQVVFSLTYTEPRSKEHLITTRNRKD